MSHRFYWSGVIISIVSAMLCVWFDRFLKNLALKGTDVTLFDGVGSTVTFSYHLNQYIAFSIPIPQTIIQIFVMIVLVILAFLYYRSIFFKHLVSTVTIFWIIVGAMSNLVDRYQYNGVIDYLAIMVGPINFPIFNVADVMIVLGVLIWLINDWRQRDDKAPKVAKVPPTTTPSP